MVNWWVAALAEMDATRVLNGALICLLSCHKLLFPILSSVVLTSQGWKTGKGRVWMRRESNLKARRRQRL